MLQSFFLSNLLESWTLLFRGEKDFSEKIEIFWRGEEVFKMGCKMFLIVDPLLPSLKKKYGKTHRCAVIVNQDFLALIRITHLKVKK